MTPGAAAPPPPPPPPPPTTPTHPLHPAAASPCIGELLVDGERHQVVLQDLPTVVESYKTLDDANLVKIADIGQVGGRGARGRCTH